MGQLSHYHSEAIKRHEAVVVTQEKTCDICQNGTVATVDGKTKMGPWANMCDSHFNEHGVGLGLGKGQRLIVQEYNPDGKRDKDREESEHEDMTGDQLSDPMYDLESE